MEEHSPEIKKDELKSFEENPYDPGKSRPEDVMRIFFVNNVPVIPVVSKTGALVGILKKDDMVSELSDIERARKQKTDQFISKLIKKVTLDDLLPYVSKTKSFVVINVFGEVQGEWSRLELLEATEKESRKAPSAHEIEKQREAQVLEWIIYLILEHIPRALYAINQNGKTIFYNSHFEELYSRAMKGEIDINFVEKSINDSAKNDFFYRHNNEEMFFYNRDMDFYYEKVPLTNKTEKLGFLIFCETTDKNQFPLMPGDAKFSKGSLTDKLSFFERMIIVESLQSHEFDLNASCKQLQLTKQNLLKKIEKYDIEYVDVSGSRKKK